MQVWRRGISIGQAFLLLLLLKKEWICFEIIQPTQSLPKTALFSVDRKIRQCKWRQWPLFASHRRLWWALQDTQLGRPGPFGPQRRGNGKQGRSLWTLDFVGLDTMLLNHMRFRTLSTMCCFIISKYMISVLETYSSLVCCFPPAGHRPVPVQPNLLWARACPGSIQSPSSFQPPRLDQYGADVSHGAGWHHRHHKHRCGQPGEKQRYNREVWVW